MTRTVLARGAAALALLTPGSIALAAPAPARRDITVTANDVAATNEKVRQAYGALVTMWTNAFQQRGEAFPAPRIARYRTSVRTSCGVMRPNNAAYCANDNTIYFDDVFVAGQAKAAALELRTDGDMAAVGVIAHEMGHAVAMQLGYRPRSSYANESMADC